ncbi:30521_t:CDS:2 [Gigaspora margarita]|uniref:30521_t:CDS:1 n=1 Tax=Gigaspora margarita TaxID=4874 RepID=A0ABN7VR80_GIGMA|nr:30521_t:CDS:2 [Gigaspora margarita]
MKTPESPTWSVRSLLSPPVKDKANINGQEQKEVKIMQHEFINLLKMARLKHPNPSTINNNSFNNKQSNVELINSETSDSQTALNKDISILCNFVKHVQNVDVSNIEPLRSFWTTEIESELINEDVENEDNFGKADANEKDMKSHDGIKNGSVLLKSAKILYGDYYIIRNN